MSAILFRNAIGAEGVLPGDVRMESTDDLSTITTPGYLNSVNGGSQILPTDVITAVYGKPMVNKQVFNPIIVDGVITLQTIGGGGDIDGAQNVGAGEGIFKQVSGDLIDLKSLVAGANISITPTGLDEITIAAVGSGGGTITGIIDAGTGQGHLAAGTSGADVKVKTLVQGSGVVITENSNTVTIAATAPPPSGITTADNLGAGEGLYASTTGTTLNFKSLVGGAGIGLAATGTEITITNTGGGGGAFQYDNAQWVAQNGNDANNGKSIDEPKLTVQAAITALAGNGVIHIEDSGTYTGAWNIGAGFDITIVAPGAFLNTTGVTLGNGCIFKVESYSFGTNFNNLFPGNASGRYIVIDAQKVRGNVGDGVNNPGQLFITAQEITGDYTFAQNLTAIIKFDTLAGDIIDTSPGVSSGASILVYGKNQTGNITSTNRKIAGNLAFSSGSPTISGIYEGCFNGIQYGFDQIIGNQWMTIANQIFKTGVILGNLDSPYTVQVSDSNTVVGIYNTTGVLDIQLPDFATSGDLPYGWRAYAWQGYEPGGGRFRVLGGDTLHSHPGPFTRVGLVEIILTSQQSSPPHDRIWTVSGALAGGAFSAQVVNVFISQVNGSDTDGTGALDSPFATINAALAYVIATYTANPSVGMNLFIIDDSIYDELLDFTGTTNINLIGREAQVNYSGIGDTITSDTGMFIALAALNCTGGGNALVNNGGDGIICNIDVVQNGNVITTGATGSTIIQAYALLTNMSTSGGASIKYQTILRSGTDGAGVQGSNIQGASGPWTVVGALTADGKLYDTTSGSPAAGDLMTFDGVSTISLQPPPASTLPYTTVAGTSQLAAVNNGYIIGNSGQTTVSLPATAPVGSVVAIKGLGAAGWIMQANGGQIIHLGSAVTSSGGSLTSANQYDNVTVICIVANTEWTVDTVISAGLTVA